ncbi:MAG: vWA domain-containing protein [Verrucomicrobiota bacterium]
MSQPKIEILPLKKGFLRAASEATHVLVRIVAPSQPADVVATPRAPLDLALVIDRSGSMSGRPLEAALESAARIVNGLRSDDRVAVVAFDGEIEVVQPLVAATDRASLVQRIRSIDARGSTDLFGGWEEAVKQLAPFTRKDRIARVILLSDGQANHGLVNEQEIFARVTKAAGAGITTSTVGLGHGFNESLMTGMATAGEGVANFGQTADDLDEAFEEQFAILSNSYLRQVKVSVQGGSDVQARLVGELLEEGVARSRKLGTLPWDASLVAVVELKIGASAKPDALAAVNFEALTKEGELLKFGPELIALPEADLAAYSVLPIDASVAAAVSEALVSEKIEAVEALARAGKFVEAKQEFVELLKRSDLTDWAKQKVEHLRNLLDEDAAMAIKEMRYGRSRMLRQTKAAMMRDFDTEFCIASEDAKPIYLQKKIVAGAARKPKPPQGGQAPQA